MRRIHILTNTLVGGGAEKQMLLCAKALADAGFRVEIWVMSETRMHPRYAPLIERCVSAGVRFHGAIGVVGLAILTGRLALCAMRGGGLWTWGFRAELLRLIIPPLWIPCGIASFRSASETEMRKRAWLLRLTLPLTQIYIANSRRGVALADRRIHGVARRSHILYNAVEPAFLEAGAATLSRPGGRLRVAMLGNLFMQIKGYDVALEMCRRLKSRGRDFELIIGGAPHDLDVFIAMRDRLDVGDVVRFVGKVGDPVEFLREADAFLLLSRYEGTPNALLEAMALGLPCGSTDVGDVALFSGQCQGLTLLPVEDAEAAAKCVEKWIGSPDAAGEAGVACRLFAAKQFSEKKMSQAVVEIFASRGHSGPVKA